MRKWRSALLIGLVLVLAGLLVASRVQIEGLRQHIQEQQSSVQTTKPTLDSENSREELSLQIVSVTSPVRPGASATLRAKTVPQAQCTIAVYYKTGKSTAQGLYPKQADSNGNVSWTWKVGTRTTPGSWRVVVTASFEGKSISKQTYFTVQ